MPLPRKSIFPLMMVSLVLMVSSLSVSRADLPEWMQRPGSLYDIFQKTPGTHVYADAVIVDKIKPQASPPYFTVRECFAPSEKLVILSPPNAQLRLDELLDVSGDVTVLSNGDMALENVTVLGYTDESGNLLVNGGPLIKGLLGRTVWDYMIDLTAESTGTSMSSDVRVGQNSTPTDVPNATSLPDPIFVPFIGDLLSSGTTQLEQPGGRSGMMTTQSYYGGIGDLSNLSDGTPVELQCKEITQIGTETIDGNTYSYLDITDSSGSIRSYCAAAQLTDVTNADRVNRMVGQIQHVGDTPVICIDDGPNYSAIAVANPLLQIAVHGKIGWARTFSDGTLLPSALTGKMVVADRSDFANNILYIEEPGRGAGIKVHYTGNANAVRDTIVDVTGTISRDSDGERYIDVGTNGTLSATSSDSPIQPLGLVNKDIGGGDYNVLTPGVSTWNGTAYAPVAGLYNIGSLVRCWGVITGVYSASTEKCLYIDDGSYLDDGTGHAKGLKVSWLLRDNYTPALAELPVGGYVGVVGISGMEGSDNHIRVLRLLSIDGIDCTPPSAPVVTDDGDTTASRTTLHASWTATDVESGVCGYMFAVGTSSDNPTNVVDWTTTAEKEAIVTANLSENVTYYFSVKAKNASGLWGDIGKSDGITVVSQAYSYDYTSDSFSTTNANGTSSLLTFDERYRLRRLENKTTAGGLMSGAAVYYTVDSVGNRIELWFDDLNAQQSAKTIFGYDFISRLTSAAYPSQSAVSYSYDWVSNRFISGLAYDKADRLIDSNDSSVYVYSGSGDLTHSDGATPHTYTYDSRGLLETAD